MNRHNRHTRRTGPCLALVAILALAVVGLCLAEAISHRSLSSKLAVDTLIVTVGAFLAWLVWVTP